MNLDLYHIEEEHIKEWGFARRPLEELQEKTSNNQRDKNPQK